MRLKPSAISIAGILLLSVIVCPTLAYNTNEIDVTIQADGSATIIADYNLNWGEYFAYTLMGNRDSIAEDAVEKLTGQDATINYITSKKASVTIPKFAKVLEKDGIINYVSPKFPYDSAGQYIDEITEDFSLLRGFAPDVDDIVPEKTKITFPDGYIITYEKPYPEGYIPSITH
ncbi:MAG: hypothetical protein PHV39_03135 [Methanomicrobium sp.]|nr:hypothetical protein [Methanomicrobium sp.]